MAEGQENPKKINITVKTPKEKVTVEIEENASIKDIRAGFERAVKAEGAQALSYGPLDHPWTFTHCLTTDTRFERIFTRNLGIAPFVIDEQHPLQYTVFRVYLMTSNVAYHLMNVQEPTVREAMQLAELFEPQIPPNQQLDQNQARTFLRSIVTNMFGPATYDGVLRGRAANESTMTSEIWPLVPAEQVWNGRNLTRRGLPATFEEITAEWIAEAEIELLGQLLYILASYPVGTLNNASVKRLGVEMLVKLIVSVCKQGNMTAKFLQKITQGVQTDIGVDINLDAESLRTFYQRFCVGVDDTNIQRILTRWIELVPDENMRVILTIVQSAGTGLTPIYTIMEAMFSFPTFPWSRVSQDFTGEWAKLIAAVGQIGNNRYYGFRKDLGVAKPTNFKNIAYIAKTLLIQGLGKVSLRTYAGWVRAIPQQEKWNWIIARFLHTSDEERPEFGDFELDEQLPPEFAPYLGQNNIYIS